MKRYFSFNSFRNIGFEEDGQPKEEELIINNDVKKDKLGNLLILIGTNNSGKSNILSGLLKFQSKNIDARDQSGYFLEDSSQNPFITICATDGNESYYVKRGIGTKVDISYPGVDDFIIKNSSIALFEAEFQNLMALENNYNGSSYLNRIAFTQNDDLKTKLTKIYRTINNYNLFRDQNSAARAAHNSIYKDYILNNENRKTEEKINQAFAAKTSINLIPNIVEYIEKPIKDVDFNVSPDNIDNSSFYKSILGIIGIDSSEIKKAYALYEKQNHNKGVLKQEKEKIQEKLDAVSQRFNKLYYEEKSKYKFNIDLDQGMVCFYIMKNRKSLSLDWQSTGFKWFFNLYFNLLGTTTLVPGDIVIMDEPATHLHVKGQEEIREMLREFAIKNRITIIVATHSEHFINLDYLEDIRIVSSNDCIASINNSFTTANKNDSDSLKAIKNSLTCDRHHIIDPDYPTVFVEGITDYDYLTGMKKCLEYGDKLHFLPINGVGKNETERKEITQELLAVCKDPILLVDNDDKGLQMQKYCKGNNLKIRVISLGDIDSNFTTIESVFDTNDITKFGLVGKEGHAVKNITSAAAMKFLMVNKGNDISETTKQNFKKVIDYLLSLPE